MSNTPNFSQPTNPVVNQVAKTLSTPSNVKKSNRFKDLNFYMVLSIVLVLMLLISTYKMKSVSYNYVQEIQYQIQEKNKCLSAAKDFFTLVESNKELSKLNKEAAQIEKEINIAQSKKEKASNAIFQKEWVVMMNGDGSLITEQWAHD